MSRRWWQVVLGVIVVLVIAAWDIGVPGHSGPAGSTASPATSPAGPQSGASPAVAGVIQPAGARQFSTVFTGSSLNTSLWDTCYPWRQQSGCNNTGNVSEREWYVPSQVHVSGGVLQLDAEPKAIPGTTASGAPKTYRCRSGMITSFPGLRFKYGYIQIVAKIPTGNGLWPALWLAAASFKFPPEIDILEAWGGPHFYAASYFHYGTAKAPKYTKANILPESSAMGWHTFSLSWTRTQLTWMLDGRVIMSSTQHIPHQQMYFIANLADEVVPGRTAPGPQCSGSLLIRSVKVWKA